MPARLTARCEQCDVKIEFDDDTTSWLHLFPSAGCTHAWPQGVEHPLEDEFFERADFVRMMRGGRVSATHPARSSEVRRTQHDIARLERRLELLKTFPEDDPFDDGDVIQFTRRLGNTNYSYVGLRHNSRWYLTGKLNKTPKSWGDLVKMLTDGNLVSKVWFVYQWEEMVVGENV